MSKKSKKGKGKTLDQTDALAYVQRKLARAVKYTSPVKITKTARRPVPAVSAGQMAALDVERFRTAARAEQVLAAVYDPSPAVRQWAQERAHAEVLILKGTGQAQTRQQQRLITDPSDPAARDSLYRASMGW